MNIRNRILLLILIIFIGLNFLNGFPQSEPKSEESRVPEEGKIESKKLERNAQILADYLGKHNSPLQYHAQDFIDAADQYDLDWRLVPAIAGVESTFGKFIPGGYNAWGWGVYGTNRIYFKSWKEGIFALAKGLKEDYISRGLTNPYSMNRRYAKSPHWGWKVAFFMADLQKFADNYGQSGDVVNISVSPIQIAVVSAVLNLR